MADQPGADKKVESAETSQEPVPSSEQTPPEAEVASPAQAEVGKADIQDEDSLPEGVKERTAKQFEKLREQLREERDKRLRAERVFQQVNRTLSPAAPSQPDYFDPETGEVNVEKLEGRIGRAETEAQRALTTAQRIISENDQKQERVAYKAHPELDPKRKEFNEDFQKAVIGYLANIYAEGKNITLKQAADKVKSFSKADLKKAQQQGATQALEELTPKEQASLEATGRSDRRQQVSDLEDLRRRTREGDQQAVLERLKNVPIVGR